MPPIADAVEAWHAIAVAGDPILDKLVWRPLRVAFWIAFPTCVLAVVAFYAFMIANNFQAWY